MKPTAAPLLLAAAPAVTTTPAPTGFTAGRGAWQRDYEKRFIALPQPEECGAILRELTRTPHLAGTEGNARVADYLAAEYRKAGFEVAMPTYDVLLSYPRSAKIEIVGEPGVALGRGEPPISSDPDTAIPEAALPWNAYAPSAEVVAPVVYVNRGRLRTTTARGARRRRPGQDRVARYFGGYRGGKSLEAENAACSPSWCIPIPSTTGGSRDPCTPAGRGGRPPISSAARTSTTSSCRETP
jgi:N-acetylated-alpha-linked acidic dipeptidase